MRASQPSTRVPRSPGDVQFNFRVESELRDEFLRVAHANDQSAAQILRGRMREYVDEHTANRAEDTSAAMAA